MNKQTAWLIEAHAVAFDGFALVTFELCQEVR